MINTSFLPSFKGTQQEYIKTKAGFPGDKIGDVITTSPISDGLLLAQVSLNIRDQKEYKSQVDPDGDTFIQLGKFQLGIKESCLVIRAYNENDNITQTTINSKKAGFMIKGAVNQIKIFIEQFLEEAKERFDEHQPAAENFLHEAKSAASRLADTAKPGIESVLTQARDTIKTQTPAAQDLLERLFTSVKKSINNTVPKQLPDELTSNETAKKVFDQVEKLSTDERQAFIDTLEDQVKGLNEESDILLGLKYAKELLLDDNKNPDIIELEPRGQFEGSVYKH